MKYDFKITKILHDMEWLFPLISSKTPISQNYAG